MTSTRILLAIVVGTVFRLWLFSSKLAGWLAERNEVVTPLTSWKRLTEGLALHRAGISPYSGDVYHEPPLSLRAIDYLERACGGRVTLLFILLDVLMAVVLDRVAKLTGEYFLTRQVDEAGDYHSTSDKLTLATESMKLNRFYVVIAFMLNPLAIATCVARSTSVFSNLAFMLAILFMLKRIRILAALFVAIATYQSLYPIVFVVPVAIYLAHADCQDVKEKGRTSRMIYVVSVMQTVVCMLSALALLMYCSFVVEHESWDFLQSTYGFILSVPDLTPNIGVFWYFFTEMFDHFRIFFLCVFQIHAFIYTVPLTFRLHDHPMFLAYMLLALTSIFKSYPSYSDIALYLSLLPLWRHTMMYTRNNLVVVVMFVVAVVMAPVLWHLWIQTGTANANFYFAITLVMTTSQIFLITDLLFAFLRREYDLRHGTVPVVVDGKPTPVILE